MATSCRLLEYCTLPNSTEVSDHLIQRLSQPSSPRMVFGVPGSNTELKTEPHKAQHRTLVRVTLLADLQAESRRRHSIEGPLWRCVRN